MLRRFGWGYAVYAFAIVALPMLGTADFQGMGRYLLGAFPSLPPPVTGWPQPHRQALRRGAVLVSALSLVALASLFGRRYYLT